MRLVETRIEEATVEEARRLDKLLRYGEDDLANWRRQIEPHKLETVRWVFTITAKETVAFHVTRPVMIRCRAVLMAFPVPTLQAKSLKTGARTRQFTSIWRRLFIGLESFSSAQTIAGLLDVG